jgi:16S rRNA G966 N2-methylase RsmD
MSAPTEILDVLEGRERWAVVCADCLDVLRELPDKCGVIVTDPPYGVGKQMAGDKAPWEVWLPWLNARLTECQRVGRLVFSFFAKTRLVRFIRETSTPPQFVINWHKPMMLHDTSLNGSPFLMHSESILYWGPVSPKEAGKLGYDSVACNALWPSQRRAQGIEHPTPKPVELLCNSLKYWTRQDDVVIDPFCGSGTHLIAALRNGRRCIGIDIDPACVAESVARVRCELADSTLAARKAGQLPLLGGSNG